MEPVVSVVIVSDYASDPSTKWRSLRTTLEAFARQDFDELAQYVYCDTSGETVPDEVASLLPGLEVLYTERTTSNALKNAAARAARADLVALVDADCAPEPDWLRHLVAALRADSIAAAVSGRTLYAGTGLVERSLAMLARSYLDAGRAAPIRFIGSNAVGFRRSLLLEYPLDDDAGAFSSRLQSEAMLRNGHRLLFEPKMVVVHEFEGWAMERDIRRNKGFAVVSTRLIDRKQPFAWITRLGLGAVPAILVGNTVLSLRDCLRCWRHYGLRAFELPVALALAPVVSLLEVPGVVAALRGRPLGTTAYR